MKGQTFMSHWTRSEADICVSDFLVDETEMAQLSYSLNEAAHLEKVAQEQLTMRNLI